MQSWMEAIFGGTQNVSASPPSTLHWQELEAGYFRSSLNFIFQDLKYPQLADIPWAKVLKLPENRFSPQMKFNQNLPQIILIEAYTSKKSATAKKAQHFSQFQNQNKFSLSF